MAEENVEQVVGVRTPVAASAAPTRRTPDERVFIRFLGLVRAFGFVYAVLPPSSRLRRALTARAIPLSLGMIVRQRDLAEREKALEAAGLSE